LQGTRGGYRLFHEYQLLGAAGQSLEPERPGAGEQIETAGAGDGRLQPIEQGLAHPIGSGSKPWKVWEIHAPAAPSAADDPHRIAAARGVGYRLVLSHSRYHTLHDERNRPARGARIFQAPARQAEPRA